MFDLNHLKDDGNGGYTITPDEKGAFECEIIKPVTVDEHVRKLARREVLGLAIRLAIATLFAFPHLYLVLLLCRCCLNITLPSLGRRSIMGRKCFTELMDLVYFSNTGLFLQLILSIVRQLKR